MGATSEAWRLSRVEKKILRCAAAGETADFTGEAQEGCRPEVSGVFLAQLWLGLIEGAKVHPFGIGIKGLAVTGTLSLGGAKQTLGGRDPLVGFMAEECSFGGDIFLHMARTETLVFTDCDLADLRLHAAEVAGAVELTKCRAGRIDLTSARVEARLGLTGCRIEQLILVGAIIEGQVLIRRNSITAPPDRQAGFDATYARIAGTLLIERCRVAGPVQVGSAETQHLVIRGCSIRHPGAWPALMAEQLRTRGNVIFERVRVEGSVSLPHAVIEGRLSLDRLFAAQPNVAVLCLNLSAVTVGQDFTIAGSALLGHVSMAGLTVEHKAGFSRLKLTAHPGYWALVATHMRCGGLSLTECRFSEGLRFDQMKSRGSVEFSAILVGPDAARARFAAAPGSGRSALALSLWGAEIEGGLTIWRGFFEGQLDSGYANVTTGVQIVQTVVATACATWSVQLHSLTTRGIISLDKLGVTSGLSMVGVRCNELQIFGSEFDSCEQPGVMSIAIWASDLVLERRLYFGAAPSGGQPRSSRIAGSLFLQNCRIGESVMIASMAVTLPERTEKQGFGIAIDFRRSRIAGDILLADRRVHRTEEPEAIEVPAVIHGCVALDDAEIGGDVILHRTTLEARGTVSRPLSHADTEERVTKRKRGVAISIRGAKIAGELEVGRPRINGLVDLRDADIAMIADGSGRRWRRAGCKPGHLLLDGLSYRSLDDLWDGDDEQGVLRPQSEVALERLRWLNMQYPDGRPVPDLFVPQPYEQLARIFAAEGNERARRQVLVAKRDLQRRHGQLSRFERAIGWMLKQISDYGYSPLRAVLSLLIFIALGSVLAWLLDSAGAMVLASTDAAEQTPFNPIVYAIDAAIPIADLNQDDLFTIDVGKLPEWSRSEAAVTLIKALYEIVGLILASVAVLTLTGTLREKD